MDEPMNNRCAPAEPTRATEPRDRALPASVDNASTTSAFFTALLGALGKEAREETRARNGRRPSLHQPAPAPPRRRTGRAL